MTDSNHGQSPLGMQIGAWLDGAATIPERESSEGTLRQAVLAGVQRRQQNRRRVTVIGSVAGVALVAAIGVKSLLVAHAPTAAIQFRVLPGDGPGQVGAYVAPTASSPVDLKFTEGSVVELEPGARARVAATTSRGATVLLETGRADVDVVHRKDAEWTIMAGPYSVRVHGTSFSVQFDPKSQLFELVMRSGVVSVEGPGISQPLQIRGAQRFVHHAGLGLEPELAAAAAPPATPADVNALRVQAEPDSAAPQVASSRGANLAAGSVASAGASQAVSWEAQVRRGEYGAVLRDAEARGVSRVLLTASSAELLALANAARFSGRADLGRDAYKAIRQRFSGSQASASAAFLLGRLTESTSATEAKHWYERYEQDAPKGALTAEAMGRRLVLTQTTGSRAEVLRLAEDYLKRFPDGPYAGVARKIAAP